MAIFFSILESVKSFLKMPQNPEAIKGKINKLDFMKIRVSAYENKHLDWLKKKKSKYHKSSHNVSKNKQTNKKFATQI